MLFNNILMMYISKWKRMAVILLVIWIVVTYLFISPLKCGSSSDDLVEFQERLRKVSMQLEALKHQNGKLISQIKRTSG